MGPLKGVPWLKDGEGLGGAAARNTYRMALAFVPAFFHHDTQKTMVEAGKVTLMLMFIIAKALLFAHVLTTETVPQNITESFLTAGPHPCALHYVIDLLSFSGGTLS